MLNWFKKLFPPPITVEEAIAKSLAKPQPPRVFCVNCVHLKIVTAGGVDDFQCLAYWDNNYVTGVKEYYNCEIMNMGGLCFRYEGKDNGE